jgi:hypothetical protein
MMSRTKVLPSQPEQALAPSNQNVTNQTIFSKASKKRSLPSFLNEEQAEGDSPPVEHSSHPPSSSKEAEVVRAAEAAKI